MVMWFDALIWLYSAQTVHCFSASDTMAKQGMLFDFHNMACKNFWLEVENKKPESLLLH